MKKKCILPIDAVGAVTYRCNARCKMCDIWQIKDFSNELKTEEFLKLPASLQDINISGGEPFLRPDLIQVIKNIKQACPQAKLIFSSNGFATNLIEQKIKEILKIDKNIGVSISIDGLAKVHEEIRGIENAFAKAIKTVDMLKKIGVKEIKLAFTLTNDNLSEMKKVFNLSKELGVGYTMSAMQNSDVYFGNKKNVLKQNQQDLKNAFTYVIKKLLNSWRPKEWARAYYVYGLYKFLTGGLRQLPIEAGHSHFFLDPTGIVYPSVVDAQNMKNIKDFTNFKELWCLEDNQIVRSKLKSGLAQQSWMICTARTAIKKHPFRVGLWVLKSKFISV